MKPPRLKAGFYRREVVVQVGQELLGKVLCTRIDGGTTKAVIETSPRVGVDYAAEDAARPIDSS